MSRLSARLRSSRWVLPALVALVVLNVSLMGYFVSPGGSNCPPLPRARKGYFVAKGLERSCHGWLPFVGPDVCPAEAVPKCWRAYKDWGEQVTTELLANFPTMVPFALHTPRRGHVYVFVQAAVFMGGHELSCAYYPVDEKADNGSDSGEPAAPEIVEAEPLLVLHRTRQYVGLVLCPNEPALPLLAQGLPVGVSLVVSHPDVPCPPILMPSAALVAPGAGDFPPLPSAPRHSQKQHRVCFCTMIKNRGEFVPEFVEYHRALGVSRFFIYDDASTDGWYERMDAELAEDVSVHAWPLRKQQGPGFAHCMLRSEPVCQWTLMTDLDEFLYLPDDRSLPQLLDWLESGPEELLVGRDWDLAPMGDLPMRPSSQVGHIDSTIGVAYLPMLVMGEANQWQRPSSGGFVENFLYTDGTPSFHNTKVIVRTDASNAVNMLHRWMLYEPFVAVQLDPAEALVYHYKRMSWEDQEKKLAMGRVGTMTHTFSTADDIRLEKKAFGWAFSQRCDTRLRDVKRRILPAAPVVGDEDRRRNPFCEPGFCCSGDKPKRYKDIVAGPDGTTCIGKYCAPRSQLRKKVAKKKSPKELMAAMPASKGTRWDSPPSVEGEAGAGGLRGG